MASSTRFEIRALLPPGSSEQLAAVAAAEASKRRADRIAALAIDRSAVLTWERYLPASPPQAVASEAKWRGVRDADPRTPSEALRDFCRARKGAGA